jgi:regulatory protein
MNTRTRRNPEQEQKLKAFARELRGLQSDAESRLWHLLRDRRFFGHKFRRQHAVENFILDFYCPEQHLAIELDGGQHTDQRVYDQQREQTLAGLGIRVVRFWNNDVLQQNEAVLQVIFDALGTPAAPHPQPLSPQAGRGEMTAFSPSPLGGGEGRGEGQLSPSPHSMGRGAGGEGDSKPRKGAEGEQKALRDKALAYLARREHTRLELARKLDQAGYPEADIEPLLDDFTQRGWLSDQRFAESYVQHKQQRFGTLKLAHELRSRGVDESIVQQAISTAKDRELEHAREIWKKRYGAPPANALEKAKQMRFLQGRGFSIDTIRRTLTGDVSDN